MDVYPIRMTAAHARKARKLGKGNLSKGVRDMIEKADAEQQANPHPVEVDRRKPK